MRSRKWEERETRFAQTTRPSLSIFRSTSLAAQKRTCKTARYASRYLQRARFFCFLVKFNGSKKMVCFVALVSAMRSELFSHVRFCAAGDLWGQSEKEGRVV
jgi:hypothetical protein